MENFSPIVRNTLIIGITLILASCSDTNAPTSSSDGMDYADISGVVLTDDTQEAVVDVLVHLEQNGSTIDSTYTSESGNFNFEDLSNGQYQVNATLPQGFEISGSQSKDITLDGSNVSVDFSAIPIREQTKTIEQGSVETLTVSSGASITVDATNATNDIEIGIEEVPSNQQSIEGSTDGEYRVTIGGFQSKSSTSSFNKSKIPLIPITISQRLIGDQSTQTARMKFNVGTVNEPFYSYALASVVEDIESNTGKSYQTVEHEFEYPNGSNLDVTYTIYNKFIGDTCKESDRTLTEYPASFTGETPLILVHGWKKYWDQCSDFEDFDPALDYFDTLVDAIISDSDITNNYKLYIYKYPTNASIDDNAAALRELMESKGIDDAVIISHSMGGLVSRSMMLQGDQSGVSKLITLGTPHEGSQLANIAYDRNLLNDVGNSLRSSNRCPYSPKICGLTELSIQVGTSIIPQTPGAADLRVSDPFIEFMMEQEGDPNEIFTLGGNVLSFSELSFSENDMSYFLVANYLFNKTSLKSDGAVPLNSAIPEWSGLRKELGGIDHSEIKDGNKEVVFSEIRSLLVGESIITSGDFAITNNAYPNDRDEDVSDWDQIVNEKFGSEYKVADWTDLENYHANGGDLLELFDDLGLTDYNQSVSVTRNGVKKYSSSRYYFASRHEGNRPGNYLAHENINNYEISLGSWWGDRKILAIKR